MNGSDELAQLENYLARRPTEVCRVLGMSYSSYAGYRASPKPLPAYVALHIATLRLLPAEQLNQLVKDRLSR